MPAPTTKAGVVFRMSRKLFCLKVYLNLVKLPGCLDGFFTLVSFLDILRHLRYFIDPVWTWVVVIQPFGKYGSILMAVGLVGLLARRIVVDRVRYISSPSDYLMLVLILCITTTGIAMSFLSWRRCYKCPIFFHRFDDF